MNEIVLFLTCLLSFLLAFYGTPIARKVAIRYNILDNPDGLLKKQKEPVPYLGGVIVYFAFISPISLMFEFNKPLLGILFASSILLLVGLFDDLRALTPGIKFTFQIIATYILIKSGIHINLIFIPPWLNAALSFLWLLTAINAFNIIDIMDGLASGIGLVSSMTILVIAFNNGDFFISIMALSLAAALAAFLRFNWQPARIYLGDAGSMLLGLLIGSMSIMVSYTTGNNLAFLAAFLVMGFPLFDLVYVIVIRLFLGLSPFRGSPDHFALRLRKKLSLDAAKTVTLICTLQFLLALLALTTVFSRPGITPALFTAAALLLLIPAIWLARLKMP